MVKNAAVFGLGLVVTLVCVFASSSSIAQGRVNSGSLLGQEQQAQPAPLQRPPASQQQLPELPRPPQGELIRLEQLAFSGAPELLAAPHTAAGLEQFKRSVQGRDFDFNGLQNLARQITAMLKQQGWLLARAYLPAQQVEAGKVTVNLIMGRLDSEGPAFVIEPQGSEALRLEPARLEAIAAAELASGDAVHAQSLERALLLINDLPTISARARFEAGQAPGSTRIHILAAEQALLSGHVQSNNLGNRLTGSAQLQAQLQLNDPLGWGDRTALSLTHSEGLKLGQLRYQLPLGSRGWQAQMAYTLLDYEVVDGPFAAKADYQGESQSLEASLSYPLLRSRKHNLWLGLGLRADYFEDQLNGILIADKELASGHLELRGNRIDSWLAGANTQWRIRWHSGDVDLSNLLHQQLSDASTFRTEGSFNKLEYSLSRYQNLSADIGLYLSLRGQYASKNLDASQKFFPGGINGVRAYPGGEASADEGQLLRAELHYNLGEPGSAWGQLQLKLFYDLAQVRLSHSHPGNIPILNAERSNRYHISGAGIGLDLVQGDLYSIGLNWAARIGDNPGRSLSTGLDSDGRSDDSRFWLQANLYF